MADAQSNIQVNIDTTQALASIKNLQRQIAAFHSSMAKGGAAANAVSAQMQQTLINSINATGKFSAQIRTIRTTTESFTSALEKNKFSLGEYFRYAGGASKTFGRLFKTEFDTINKVARENVKDLQTQYIRMGRDASGAMKAIAVRPLSLDMNDLATRTQIAAQKQAILNQLLKQGSTNLLNFGKNTQWAGRQLMVGFTLPLIALGSAASKTFMDMEAQAIRFKKVYGDLFTPNAESAQALKDIQDLGKEFTKYGIAVSTTVGLAAEAAAAGFKGVDLQRQTAAATRLSILGQVDSQKALETTIALQNAFSMSSENLAESIDFLNAVENQTVLSLDDISTAIPKAAPVVQQLGGDVKDLAFLMTAMKEGGINASEGANALKSGLASLINPTGKANDMLLSFGINAKKIVLDNKGDLKKTVVEFATALNMLDPLNRAQAIEQMFGKFQFARLSTLFANVTKEGTQASRVLDLAGASVQELAGLAEKELGMTSESAMNKFKGAVENLKLSLIPLGEQFLKAVTPIAEFITRVLDKFNNFSDTTKKIIVTITGIVAGLGPVLLMTAGLVMNGLANMIKLFAFLKSAFNKTGQSTAMLGTEVHYMTTEQRNAAAVAASLDQVHVKLAQTFTSEASAVNALTRAYQRAIAAQSQFVPVAPPITRGPIKKFATGKPATVGGTGNKDSELALLMPGETVIPTAMSKKYGGLINAMIADRIPGYDVGKPGPGDIPIYPEYAMRLQDAGENMAQRASATAVPNVLSPLALRIGEARGISPTQRQIDSGAFDSIYDEYKDITTQFVDRVNLEYNETFKDIKDENERMQKAWSAAGKHVEKQVDSIESVKDRSVVRKVFALDEDEYGTIPTDSREKGGTAPNRARRGAFRSRMTGFRSYTDIRAGAKRLFSRKTGTPAESLQMGHVFGPRTVPIETLEADPRRTASVASARKVLDRGKKDGAEYAKGVDSVVKDPYELSQDRSSPHRRAAPDGKADGTAYVEARDKAITQAGRRRRVATRGQGPAPIGATPQPGMTVLPIVPPDPKKPDPKPQGRLARMGGKMSSMGGGMGILGANMGLSMAPDFAGKGMLQGTLAGANLGMMFGPAGMKAGAAIGLVTSAFSALIAKQKEHAAITRSTFTVSTDLITLLGDKVLDTQLKITGLSSDVTTFVNEFGMLSPEIQAIVDAISKLPEENPLAIFVKNLSESDMQLKSVTGSIRSQVTTAVSMGGLDPKNAEKYVLSLLTAAGKAHMFGEVWKSVSKDVIDVSTATTVSFDKLNQEVEKSGASWEHYVNGVPRATKGYNDLSTAQQILADQMKNMLGLITSGSLTFDEINTRIDALDKSSISSSTAIAALSAAIYNSNDEAAIERLKGLNRVIANAGETGKQTTGEFYRMQLALEMLARRGKSLGDVGVKLFGAGAQSVSDAFVNLVAASDPSNMKEFFDNLAEEQARLNKVLDYTDYEDGADKAKTASELYLEVLEKEIKGLEAKRDAQKNANDETQRQIDLQMKLKDLANQAVLAKISGDYIKAATLQQQAQNVQMEFDQETELRKKDAEIARLRARAEAIKGGATLTKEETAKIPKDKLAALKKDPKAKNNASGGMIRGAGTGTSDSIPAYLSNGEYVIKADSVKKYGTGTFDALNAQRLHTGGPVGHKHGPAEAAARLSSNRFNIPVSAGSTASMFSPATGLASDPRFRVDRKESDSFFPMLGGIGSLLLKPLTPSTAPEANKQSSWSKNVRKFAEIIKPYEKYMMPGGSLTSWLFDPLRQSAVNLYSGDAKWNDITNIASNLLGTGAIKGGITGIKSVASKITSPAKKIINLPAARKAEQAAAEAKIADQLEEIRKAKEWAKNNPPPPRPGGPGAPPSKSADPWDDMDWGAMPEFDATPVPTAAAKPSILSKISESPIGTVAKTLSKTVTTPAYHLKTMGRSIKRAWQYGPTSSMRWTGSFNRFGRMTLIDELISRLFGGLATKFNPKLSILAKQKNMPNFLPEGATIFDPLSFFEKLLLDPELAANFYSTSYKNIIPNISKNFVRPFISKGTGKVKDTLNRVAFGSKRATEMAGEKTLSMKDTMVGLMKSLSYRFKSSVKDKYRSFLNIFSGTKIGKPFNNSPIDYRALRFIGEKANSLHAPEIAEEIFSGGSQYYVKMVSELAKGKELFGSEWISRIDLPGPVNRPVTNAPTPWGTTENTETIASESFAPRGYQTVKDFIADMSNPGAFNPTDLGEIVKRGLVRQRLAADVAQSVIGHGDLHPGNQIIAPATGDIGMLDFETILGNDYVPGFLNTISVLKLKGVSGSFIADALKEPLERITAISPVEILEMMKRAKVPNPEALLETYMSRLSKTKKDIEELIATKLFLADGGYLNKGKIQTPKFAKGGLIRGPGTGISDSIKATLGYAGGGSIRVSNGEYVVKASSVRDYGVKAMDAINNGTATVGAGSGGTVYNINMPVTSNNANPEIVANEVMRKLKLEISKNNKTNKVGP